MRPAPQSHRRAAKRRAPASQGHPSRGGTSVGGGTQGRKPTPYVTPTKSVAVQRGTKVLPKPSAPSRAAYQAKSKRRAAVRSHRATARLVRGIAGVSTPLGEMERQSMRFGARRDEAAASLPAAQIGPRAQHEDTSPSAGLPRNRYVPKLPQPEEPLRGLEKSYLDHATLGAKGAYAERRKQAGKAERKSARHMAATREVEGRNLADKAIGFLGAGAVGSLLGTQAGAKAQDAIDAAGVKPTRLPPALWHGVTEGRADDVDDPNAVQLAEGAIGGLIESTLHPKKAVKAMADDLEKRYGDYVTGRIDTDEYKRRVAHTPRISYLADAAALVPIGGTATAAAGKVLARGVAKSALQHGAKDAARKATRVADYLDPKVARPRLAANGSARPQRTPTTGGFRLTMQRELDRSRARHTAKRAEAERPDTGALNAIEQGAVQARTSVGRARVGRKYARPEYSRWRAMLHQLQGKHGTKVGRDVKRLIGRDKMKNGSLAFAMTVGPKASYAEVRAAATELKAMFERERDLAEKPEDQVFAHDNITEMERLIANPEDVYGDLARMQAATELIRANNEVLKEKHPDLDEGVRVHELEGARRVYDVPKGQAAALLDAAAEKAIARNARKQAKRTIGEASARQREIAAEQQAVSPRSVTGAGGATPLRNLSDKELATEVKQARAAVKSMGAPEANDPAGLQLLDNAKRSLHVRELEVSRRSALAGRHSAREYLDESRAKPAQPMTHGTTAERAAKIEEEGFDIDDAASGGAWGYLDREGATLGGPTQAEREARAFDYAKQRANVEGGDPVNARLYSDARNPLDLRTPEGQAIYADNFAHLATKDRAAAMRAHEPPYDAIITREGAINVIDKDRVSSTPPVRPDKAAARDTAYLQNLQRETAPEYLPHSPVGTSPAVRQSRYIEAGLRKKGVDTKGISYLHADPTDNVERAAFAPGQGQHAPAKPKETTYETLATGRMNMDMTKVLPEQVARSVKANVAGHVIAEVIDKWTPEHITTGAGVNLHARGISYAERKTIESKAPEVLDTYVWWNPGMNKRLIEASDHPESIADDFLNKFKDDWDESIDSAGQHPSDGPWYLLDQQRAAQMQQSIAFNSTLAARLSRKILKGFPSKLVLMASPSWAALQVLNNAGLAGLAGMVNPFQYARAAKLMHSMKADFPDEYERLMGAGSQGLLEHEFERTRLGSTGDKVRQNHPTIGRPLAYFKDTWERWNDAADAAPQPVRGAWSGAKSIGSFRFLFHGDALQNAFFRKTFMMDEANRIKFNGLDRAMQQEAGAIARVMRGFKGDQITPEEMAALARNPEAVEHMAQSTNELFGNYTDFTPMERKVLEGNIMFYGFIRFSLRFTLYTMPVQHPLTTALLLKLSALRNEEVRDLLKTGPNDPIPFGAIGALYKMDGNKIVGKLPTNRVNPFLNPVTSSLAGSAPKTQLLTSLSPMATELLQQVLGTSFFTGKNWYLKGPHESQRMVDPSDPRLQHMSLEDRGRVALSHMLQLPTPGRIASQESQGGRPVAETSLPWSPQPIRFKDEDTVKSIRKRAKEEKARGSGDYYLRGLLDPIYSGVTGDWAPSYDREVAKYLKEREDRYLRPPKHKKRRTNDGSVGGGSGVGGSVGGSGGL